MHRIKFLCLVLCILLLPAGVLAAELPTQLQQTVIFEINSNTAIFGGKRQIMDVPVLLRDDRSTVPIKFIGEWFGGDVQWDGKTRSVSLSFPEMEVRASIDDPQLWVNGVAVTVEPAPFLYQDRTYFSVRTVADLLGIQVYYSSNDMPVILTDKEIHPEQLPAVLQAAQDALHPDSLLSWPVEGYYQLSAVFQCGNPDCYSHNGGKNGHGALDIPAPAGTPVSASADGVVTFAGFGGSANGYTGYGNIVVIDHGNGIATHYAHLQEMTVQAGDSVSRGGTVGTVGSTGYVTGNHLDFAVWKDGKKVDPLPYLDIPAQVSCYEECDQLVLDAAKKRS